MSSKSSTSKRRSSQKAGSPAVPVSRGSRLQLVLICVALLVACVAIYGQACGFGFIYWDDDLYVRDHPQVRSGLSPTTVAWALRGIGVGNWHPVTWLSLMLDSDLARAAGSQTVAVGSDDAGVYHLTNLLLHSANAILLFLLLAGMTGCRWRGAFVAFVFAVHPLHVESVAWVAERKDVLSTLFWLLTILAYARFVRRRAARDYVLVMVLFALGLMSKPMLVTLPLTLLLLDYWPLGRRDRWWKLVAEKIPLFAMSAASCVVTLVVQRMTGAAALSDVLDGTARAANAVVSYVSYVVNTVWPANLGCFYPHPRNGIPTWQVVSCALVMVAATVLSLRQARKRPWAAVGWLWYVVTLIPVIGLIQVGEQAMADRYMYVPMTGLLILVAWGVPEVVSRFGGRHGPAVTAALAGLAILALSVAACRQVGHWRDGESLWTHNIRVTRSNAMAEYNLGCYYDERTGDLDRAIVHFKRAVDIDGDMMLALNNLSGGLLRQDDYERAEPYLERLVRIAPDYAPAHANLGVVLENRGDPQGAEREYEKALSLDSTLDNVRQALAELRMRKSRE